VLLEALNLTDLARKVVGVGSVGTRAYIALMLGRDEWAVEDSNLQPWD
jgi:Uncharacterized protein conserved in bacteria (DUF2252)